MSVRKAWGMACPKCDSDRKIDIVARISVRLMTDGTDPDAASDHDHEWDDASTASCHACDFAGTVKDFKLQRPFAEGVNQGDQHAKTNEASDA